MSPSEMQQLLDGISKSESPFMLLFIILIGFLIFMAVRIMNYVSEVTRSNDQQIELLTQSNREQREMSYKMFQEEKFSAEKREKAILEQINLNTKQLENVATTLKDMQHNVTTLEKKVDKNFEELNHEIERVRGKT